MDRIERRLATTFLIYQAMKVAFSLARLLLPLGFKHNAVTGLLLAGDLVVTALLIYVRTRKGSIKAPLTALMLVGYGLLVWGQVQQVVGLETSTQTWPFLVRSLYGFFVFFIVLTVLLAWVAPVPLLVAGVVGWQAVLGILIWVKLGGTDLTTALILVAQGGATLLVGILVSFLVRLHKGEEKLLRTQALVQEELAISWERNRMARELHDTLAHSLSAIAVQLEASRTLRALDPARSSELADRAHGLALDGLKDTRTALESLRAAPLQDQGLVLALEALARDAARRAGAGLVLDLPTVPLATLPGEAEHALYRMAQEALENAVRHSGATTLWVTLSAVRDTVNLKVADNGCGFDPEVEVQGRFGLAGLRERAKLIGASTTIVSSSAHGTEIQIALEVAP